MTEKQKKTKARRAVARFMAAADKAVKAAEEIKKAQKELAELSVKQEAAK
jgi:Fe2+ or Zn2+ uptake regulation protein